MDSIVGLESDSYQNRRSKLLESEFVLSTIWFGNPNRLRLAGEAEGTATLGTP